MRDKVGELICSRLVMPLTPHLVQYQGSKRNLAKHIIKFIPRKIDRFIEPFSGTAAMSIAVANAGIASNFWLNDINEALVQLLNLAISEPVELSKFYSQLWNEQHFDSVSHYFDVRKRFNETNDPRLFLYLLARCVKGAVRYNSDGNFNQSPDKRRKGTRPERMRKNILGVSNLLKDRCKFTNLDYQEVFEKAKSSDFVYMDPPYQGVCGHRDSRYLAGIDFDRFVLSLKMLNERGIDFALSYDGKLGDKSFGKPLPPSLELMRIEIEAGRSSQSTLLGKREKTIESLYLSPNVAKSLASTELRDLCYSSAQPKQLTLLEEHGRFSIAR